MINKDLLNHHIHILLLFVLLLLVQQMSYHILDKLFRLLNFSYYKLFVSKVKPDCISIDYDVNPNWAKLNLKNICIQGGLNPKMLLKSEKKLMYELNRYLKVFSGKPYIFNLGHGIMPNTNPSTVNKIINQVRSFNGR